MKNTDKQRLDWLGTKARLTIMYELPTKPKDNSIQTVIMSLPPMKAAGVNTSLRSVIDGAMKRQKKVKE